MFGFGKKSVVGVDIGTSSIKLVELSRENGHFKLETYGVAQMTKTTNLVEGQSPLSLAIKTLGELLAKARVSTRHVVASLPTSTVFISVIEIPKLGSTQQKKAIELEAKKIIPLPIEDVTVSWNLIPNEDVLKAGRDLILLTAVPNHVIANYLKVFQELKLQPEAIEVEATALVRSLVGQDNSVVLILDIGSKTSTINLIDKGFIYYSKNINVGGEAITSGIAQALNVNPERAEQFKRSLSATSATQSKEIPRAIQPIVEIIKVEVDQLIHLAAARGRAVEKIILSGGGSKFAGLDKFFSSFNIPITLGNPWARVVVPPQVRSLVDDLGPTLAVGTGLAMRMES